MGQKALCAGCALARKEDVAKATVLGAQSRRAPQESGDGGVDALLPALLLFK